MPIRYANYIELPLDWFKNNKRKWKVKEFYKKFMTRGVINMEIIIEAIYVRV